MTPMNKFVFFYFLFFIFKALIILLQVQTTGQVLRNSSIYIHSLFCKYFAVLIGQTWAKRVYVAWFYYLYWIDKPVTVCCLILFLIFDSPSRGYSPSQPGYSPSSTSQYTPQASDKDDKSTQWGTSSLFIILMLVMLHSTLFPSLFCSTSFLSHVKLNLTMESAAYVREREREEEAVGGRKCKN